MTPLSVKIYLMIYVDALNSFSIFTFFFQAFKLESTPHESMGNKQTVLCHSIFTLKLL